MAPQPARRSEPQIVLALEALDKAIANAGDDGAMRAALDQACHGVAACVQTAGVAQAPTEKPEAKPAKRKRNNTAMATAN